MTDRSLLAQSRRIIIKLGSKVISSHESVIGEVCRQIVELSVDRSRDFLIVSSGAIALGYKALGYEAPRPAWLSVPARR